MAEAAEAEIALAEARVSAAAATLLLRRCSCCNNTCSSSQAKHASLEVSTGKLMDHHFAYKQGIEAALAAMGSSFEALKEAAE